MNKCILMGRLTKEPELKYTTTNMAVCNFTLAVNRRFAKEGQVSADFINIITWNKTAEFCSKWFKKGQQVAAVGSIQTRTWDDKEGKKHYATEVVADEAYFAEGKQELPNTLGNNTFQIEPEAAKGFTPQVETQRVIDGSEGFYPIGTDQLPF